MSKIKSFIRKLRSKPEDTRRIIFVVSLASSMIVVILIWISGITNPSSKKVIKEKDSVEETNKLFAVIKDGIKETIGDLAASLKDINIMISGIKEDIEREKEIIEISPIE